MFHGTYVPLMWAHKSHIAQQQEKSEKKTLQNNITIHDCVDIVFFHILCVESWCEL